MIAKGASSEEINEFVKTLKHATRPVTAIAKKS
jgi:hypothetical protein